MSPGTSASIALAAFCPGLAVSRTWPMCETSNRPAAVRVCACSARMPVGYCTGIS